MNAEATVKVSGERKKLREQNLGYPSAKDPVYPPSHPKAPSQMSTGVSIGAPPPTGDTSASASESTRGFDLGGMLAWLMTREHYNSHVHSTGTLAADTTALVYQSRAMRGPIRMLAEGEASEETSEEKSEEGAMDASDDEEDAMDASDGEREAVDMAVAAATPSRVLTRSTTAAIQQAADVARKEYMEQRKRAQARLLPTVFCMAEARELAARADRQAGVCRAFSSKRRRDSDEGNPSTPAAPRRQRLAPTEPAAPATESMKIDAGAVALNAVRLAQLTVDSQWCGVRRAR